MRTDEWSIRKNLHFLSYEPPARNSLFIQPGEAPSGGTIPLFHPIAARANFAAQLKDRSCVPYNSVRP